mgnify:CR=1 FL=1
MKPSLLAAQKRRALRDSVQESSDESDSDDLGPPQKSSGGLAALLSRGRAPSGAPRIHTVGNSKDAKDARYLREQMDKLRPHIEKQAEEEQLAYDSGVIPQWHLRALDAHRAASNFRGAGAFDAPEQPEGDNLLSLEGALASAADFISYEQLVEISHTDNLISTLGGMDAYKHTAFVRKCNREKLTFEHVYANMEKLLSHTIHETELFALRPEQRLTVAMEFLRLSEEAHCTTKMACHKDGVEEHHFAIPPGTRPSLSIMTLGTGNGKTIVTILAAVTAVCVPALWNEMQSQWKNDVSVRTTLPHLGLSKRRCIATEELARVVIAFVPEQLIEQWAHTLRAVQTAMEEKQMGFDVWEGLGVLQRKGRGPKGQRGIRRTLTVAHEHTKAQGRPLFWLVKASTESATQTLRDAPHLSFAYRIFDECSTRTEPRQSAKESEPMRDIICQATIGRLARATESTPRHPLRKALGSSYSVRDPAHASIFHLTSVPNWLRLMMGRSMRALMPAGLRCLHLKIKIQSMSGRLLKSDLTITCLDDLLRAVLRSTGDTSSFTTEEIASLMERCKVLLSSAETPIHTRLVAAAADATAALEKLPALAPDPTAEMQIAYRPIAHQKRINNAMKRLFDKLAQSVNHESPPICPISEEPIAPEDVAIFFCCTTPFDKRYSNYLNNNCPNCGVNLGGRLLMASAAIGALTSQPPKPPPTRPTFVGDEDALVAALHESKASTFISSIKAVIATVEDFLRFKPNGARILLAFACQDHWDGTHETAKTRRTLLDAVPSLRSVDAVTSKGHDAVSRFVTPSDENRALVINTSCSSVSLEGLDLWNADLIVLDKCGAGRYLRTETIVQAIGRVLRPQYEPYVPGQPERVVKHPAKLLVLLEPVDAPREAIDDQGHEPAPAFDDEDGRSDGGSDGGSDEEGWEQFDPRDLVDVVVPQE